MITQQSHPKAYTGFKNWLLQEMQKQGQTIPSEISNQFPVDKMVNLALTTPSGVVRDYLESVGYYTGTWYEKGWKWRLDGPHVVPMEGNSNSRKEAEISVTMEALNRIEK